MDTARALQYVTQAQERLAGLLQLRAKETGTPLTTGPAGGLWRSLEANLESAKVDLTPEPAETPP